MSEMRNSPRYTSVNRVFITWLCANLVGACRDKYTRGVVIGYRCENEDRAYRNISSVTSEKCTWQCMKQSNCVQINYNNVGNYCLLFSSFCTLAEPDEKFTMLRLVDDVEHRDECIRWISFTGTVLSSGAVINKPAGSAAQHLARGTVGNAVIPGKLFAPVNVLWSVHNGQVKRITNNVEYLDIHPSCFGVWVPYISDLGMDLPTGAVQGGVTKSGTPLYVARASNSIRSGTSLGYYNPHIERAIHTDGTKVTSTRMDILVLVWTIWVITNIVVSSVTFSRQLNENSTVEYTSHGTRTDRSPLVAPIY